MYSVILYQLFAAVCACVIGPGQWSVFDYVGRKVWICAIRGMPCAKHGSALCASHPRIDPRLRTHDEREGSLLATWRGR